MPRHLPPTCRTTAWAGSAVILVSSTVVVAQPPSHTMGPVTRKPVQSLASIALMNSSADGQAAEEDGLATAEPDDALGAGDPPARPDGSASERHPAAPTTQASTARQSNGRKTAPLCTSRTFRADRTPSLIARAPTPG